MNSRERLLTALNLGTPDRVPINTYELQGFNPHDWANGDSSYARLMQQIREYTDGIYNWGPSSNIRFLMSAYPVEMTTEVTREGEFEVTRRTLQTPKGPLTQVTKIKENVHTVWEIEHWCKSIEDVDRALSIPFEPPSYDGSAFQSVRDELGDHGIVMNSLVDPLLRAGKLMSFSNFTLWALTERDHFMRAVRTCHERTMECLRRELDSAVVDLYRICGPEYATPPYLPADYFREGVVPYVSEMVDLLHHRGAKARLHCHGKIATVLDMIVETGADAIDPCEPPPDGDIELADVKKRVGDKLCIFGNIELHALEQLDRNDIVKLVKEILRDAMEGGGFVLLPTAAPINTPLALRTEENYLAMIETALEYGRYNDVH